MKITDLIGTELTDEEKGFLKDAILRTGLWIKTEVEGDLGFDTIELPDRVPESADDALARLKIINASLDGKAKIKAAREAQRANVMKAAQKIMLAVLERGLPFLLTAV